MVKVSVTVEDEKKLMYIDNGIHNQLVNYVKKDVIKKDFDYLFIVDGMEGSGKSVLAQQLAKVLDPNFNIDNIAFTPKEFIKCVDNAKKYTAIIFDEAFTGLSSRSSLSEINNLMVQLMMEMRQKNLFVIIVMPTVFMLDKYVVLHRAKCMFHVYIDKSGNRGQWMFYGKTSMKYLYLNGKKFYNYSQKPNMIGKFLEFYTVNEKKYRTKKNEAIKLKSRKAKNIKYKEQRNNLIYILNFEFDCTYKDISEFLIKYGGKITARGIGKICEKKKELFSQNYATNHAESEV